MIDIELVRNQPDMIRELCHKRFSDVDVERLIEVDKQLRETTVKLDALRHEQKKLKGPENREKGSQLKAEITQLEDISKDLRTERDSLWEKLPNLLAPDTPEGNDDSYNVEIFKWGQLPSFDFKAKTHEVIGSNLGILDLQRGVNVASSGFPFWKGDGARMVWAIFSLAQDFLIQRGFIPMLTPILAKGRTLFGTGYLPFFKDDIYKLENEDLCLIGTSEQTLVGYHMDEIIPASSLPLLYCACTPCFRTEAGSYGKESR